MKCCAIPSGAEARRRCTGRSFIPEVTSSIVRCKPTRSTGLTVNSKSNHRDFLVSLVKSRLPSDLPERERGRPQVAPLQGLGADCDLNLFKGSNSSDCRGGTCARPCTVT